MSQYVEVAVYRLKPTITAAQFLEAADATLSDFQKVDGFISHQLFESEDGQWLDLVYYDSKETAVAAEAQLAQAPSIQTIMGMLELKEDNWFHVTPIRHYSS